MEIGSKKWTVPETRHLISQFEDSPCLWDMFNKDYRNKDMKSTAVTKIALSLGVKVDEVKRKIYTLRYYNYHETRKGGQGPIWAAAPLMMMMMMMRCQYTSELKKTRINKSGQGANERYVTTAVFRCLQ
jgi:hypothetical protein